MKEDKNNDTEIISRKRPPKNKHIDVRFTEDEFNTVLKNAQLSGRNKSIYLHDIALGHKPSLPMTTEQQEALKGLTGARAELVYIRNALHALPQTERRNSSRERISWSVGFKVSMTSSGNGATSETDL